VYLSIWLVFVFALADSLTVRSGNADTSTRNGQLINSINTVQIFQLGLLSIIPYWGELCLESGLLTVRSLQPLRLDLVLRVVCFAWDV
jgi:hypothetical protein